MTIQIFTDPMMGLSYESEPVLRKLETHFPGRLRFRYRMALLVGDVYAFVHPNDLRFGRAEALRRYNKRLAGIYKDEESIGGLPINMDGFCLFDEAHPSSLPLNLAFKAVEQFAPEKAEQFLYLLRYATIAETRPTTHFDEILRVVKQCGLSETEFTDAFHSEVVRRALEADIQAHRSLNVFSLPTYVLEYGDRTMVIPRLLGYDDFVRAIASISDGALQPETPDVATENILSLCRRHPLISGIELREAFDFASTDDVLTGIRPLLDGGNLAVREVPGGWFIDYLRG